MSFSKNPSIFILYDEGKIGTLRQCEALGQTFAKINNVKIQTIAVNPPLWIRLLIPRLTRFIPYQFLAGNALLTKLRNTPPEIIIAAGRKSVLLAASLAKKFQILVIMNPRCPLSYFDLVIAPTHDNLPPHTSNLIEIIGSLTSFDFPTLSLDQSTTLKKSQNDPYIITVLLGGDSRHYVFKDEDFYNIGSYLKKKTHPNKKYLITKSRRTPKKAFSILQQILCDENVTFWPAADESQTTPLGHNPYTDFLQAADEIIVTGDSISMSSEACYFGKPVIIWRLAIKDTRFTAFFDTLVSNKYAVYENMKFHDCFQQLRETERVASLILKKLNLI
jgi:mitochondrial fission protein ELM1